MRIHYITLLFVLLTFAGCELLETEPDYHVEKYFGTYICRYHLLNNGQVFDPDSTNLRRDSVHLIISRGQDKNELMYYTANDPLFPTPKYIPYDKTLQTFYSHTEGVSHTHSNCKINFNGDSVRLDFMHGMYNAEAWDVLIGVKAP
ncbi:MAG: hypothetical protein K1X81_03785 [Bacteroidia bacterium]|nr:hypothetical protein [Bacteroidia bacterium]